MSCKPQCHGNVYLSQQHMYSTWKASYVLWGGGSAGPCEDIPKFVSTIKRLALQSFPRSKNARHARIIKDELASLEKFFNIFPATTGPTGSCMFLIACRFRHQPHAFENAEHESVSLSIPLKFKMQFKNRWSEPHTLKEHPCDSVSGQMQVIMTLNEIFLV